MDRAIVSCVLTFLCVVHLCWGQACVDGWTHYEGSCYLFVPGVHTWFDAQTACNTQKGKLVEIESAPENDFVKSILSSHHAVSAWIGLEDQRQENEFVWSSSQERAEEYTHWMHGEPNDFVRTGEDCVKISHNGEWIDESCKERRYSSVCEKVADSEVIG